MTTPSGGALERCVGDAGRFLAEHWARAPLHRPGADAGAFADLIALADVDRLIAEGGLRFPALKVVERGATLPSASFTRSARVGGVAVADLVSPAAVYEHFAAGATIVLTSLHRHWPPLGRFCRALERELTHPVQVNLYLTPPEAQGLNLHYDTHDVFVLQLHGTKDWQVHERAVEAPLAHQHGRVDPERPGRRLLAERLAPGDALYVPRGFVHAAITREAASAHLTVGVLAYTWIDVLRALVTEAEAEPALRAALPPGFAAMPSEALASEVAARLRWLGGVDPQALAERVQRRFRESRAPALSGQLQRLLALDEIADTTPVRRRPDVVPRVRVHDSRLVLELPDRALELPDRVAPAVAHLLDHESVQVAELGRWLDEEGRLVLVRRLIREGVLEPVR